MFCFRIPLFALALATASLSSCQKDDPTPSNKLTAPSQQLTTGSWRLDQIKQDGQVTGNAAGIKDRYSLKFRADGTYTQTLLASNTDYNGTWMLMTNDTELHLTDHKGTANHYTLAGLSATEFRYTYTTKTNQLEERTFSAQP